MSEGHNGSPGTISPFTSHSANPISCDDATTPSDSEFSNPLCTAATSQRTGRLRVIGLHTQKDIAVWSAIGVQGDGVEKAYLRAAGRLREEGKVFSRWNSFSDGMGVQPCKVCFDWGFWLRLQTVRFSEIRNNDPEVGSRRRAGNNACSEWRELWERSSTLRACGIPHQAPIRTGG